MPIYTYQCTECHKVFDEFSIISKRNELKECKCGCYATRDVMNEFKGMGNVDATMKENERWSWSMGVHVDQIPAMEKKYPGSQYHPKTGQLLIRNREHKKTMMRQRGLIEFN